MWTSFEGGLVLRPGDDRLFDLDGRAVDDAVASPQMGQVVIVNSLA